MRKPTISRVISAGAWALLALVLLCSGPLQAAEVKGLYEAEMLVPDQSRGERGLAMSAALAEVVTKVSGRPEARLQPKVAEAIRRPARLLQQYRYRALPEAMRDETVLGDDPQLVFFRFDRQAVNRLLRDSGLPVWGATRPLVLAWVAVDDGERRYLLGADGPGALRETVEAEARRRGLPLLLPLLDLEDQRQVGFADVWGRFREPVLAASRRYRPEAVLLGRLSRTAEGEWRADWEIVEGRDGEAWQANGALAAEVVDEGVSGALGWLAARYAPLQAGEGGGRLWLTVSGVESLAEFADVERYLRSLQQVGRVQARVLERDRVEFLLDLQGSADSMAQTIALGHTLVADTFAEPEPAPAVPGGRALIGRQYYRLRH